MSWSKKEILFFFYVVIMLMPMQVLLVPNFLVINWLNIQGSYLALILPAMFHPFGVVLIRQQLKAFPKETLEAARLDGASEWKAYLKIVRPNIGSVTAAVMVLLFADNWNMIDQAVVFIDKTFKMPMSVVLNQISDENPQLFFSASCLYLVPAVLVFLLGQNDLKEGISLSGIKM
jgi:multiple sugar transport system permease protein